MGDVSEILGLSGAPKESELSRILGPAKPAKQSIPKKPKGVNREVFGLLGQESIVPALQTLPAGTSFKAKRSTKGGWVQGEIFNCEADRLRPQLKHWVKSELANCEYPYLKFDVKSEKVSFTEDEYNAVLKSDKWTVSESEYLLDLCQTYDLRWPVIADRYSLQPFRRLEELQDRYYNIVAKLSALRDGHDCSSADNANPYFNVDVEKARRIQQELLFYK